MPRRRRLDLNSADLADLASVPGLDAALAQRILAHRPYGKLKELLRVPGVEPELYEHVAPYLKVVLARDVVKPPAKSAAAASAHASRRKPRPASPPALAEPVTFASAPVAEVPPSQPAPTPVWQEVVHEPEVIVVEPRLIPGLAVERRLMPTAAFPRALTISPVATASEALFNSYAGPRIVFALFSITLALLAIGFSTGRLTLAARQTAASPSPSPETLSTPVSAVITSTLAVLPSPTLPAKTAPTATSTPVSTVTPIPTVSPTSSFVSNSGLVGTGAQIFNETFVPPGYWNVGENDFSNIFIAEGQLTIRMKLPGAIAWAVNGFAGQDFFYQGTARVGACRAGDYYGLAFRAKDDFNLYLFGLSCDGTYRLVRRENGEFKFLVDFTFTPEAVAGSNATNLLAVRAQGDQLSFFVNDHFLTSVGDTGSGPGLFGVFAKAFETKDLQVDFDDLSAWQLSP